MADESHSREIVALEYLVSAACDFMVELHEDHPGEFYIQPATHEAAADLGDVARGERFWKVYGKKSFDSPFEASVMFVNAMRIWEQKMADIELAELPPTPAVH